MEPVLEAPQINSLRKHMQDRKNIVGALNMRSLDLVEISLIVCKREMQPSRGGLKILRRFRVEDMVKSGALAIQDLSCLL